jgi:hypothetical protein
MPLRRSRYTRRMPNPRDWHLRRIALVLATIVGSTIIAAAGAEHAVKPPLENFYVVTQATFHSGVKWVDHILEVRPQGDDVLVREIRIAPLDKDCPHHVTVRAVERVMPNTTVKKLTVKFPICAFEEDVVEGMISVVKREESLSVTDDAASQTIVASCGSQQKMFELPDQETLRFEALQHADKHVTDFWDLAATMEAHAFGNDFSLAKLTPEEDKQAQDLGAKLVPEIKSGRYDQGFSDQSCAYAECSAHNAASALQGYTGPIFSCPKE